MFPHARALPVLRTVLSADRSLVLPALVLLGLETLLESIQVFVRGLILLILKVPLLFLSQSLSPSNLVGDAEVGCTEGCVGVTRSADSTPV